MRSYSIHIHEPDLNVGARTINGGAVQNGLLAAASITANNFNSTGVSATLAGAHSIRTSLYLRRRPLQLAALFFLLGRAAGLWGQTALPDADSVTEAMNRANNYWITNNDLGDAGWARSTYFTGNQRAARVLVNRSYLNRAFSWAGSNQWLIGPEGAASANAYCCGQTYVDLYRLNPQLGDLTDITNRVNAWLSSSATNQFTWIDAFYMAGPTFARLGNLTGDTNYFQKLWEMYSYMKDGLGLYDTNASLWYRDVSYIYPAAKNANGGKVFWSRGNGWVFAGLTRVLQQMPVTAPHYQDFAAVFRAMAAALAAVQGADGLWRSSLYDYQQFTNPETSGTGFFTYGLAWGIRSGLLPAAYTNSVVLAWNGLTNLSLNPSGFVGWVQNEAAAPGATTATNTRDYGVGAFLLACSEIELLASNGPALGPWAGPDQTLLNPNPTAPVALTLDSSQTEVYRGAAGLPTWWEGASQIASSANATVLLSTGTHVIVLKVPGADGVTYTDAMTVSVITPVLKLRFDFEESGNTTTDSVSGVSLRLVNAAGVPDDLHGVPGSGVGGYGQSLNLADSSMGGNGSLALVTNETAASIGNLKAFTLAFWIKPASSLLASTFPRFFTLGTNGIIDRGVPNSLQLLSNGNLQSGTSVQVFINTTQTSTTAFGAFDMPSNQWSFLALTYDGAILNLYGGSETNPVALKSSTSFSAGVVNLTGAWTLMLGNNLAQNRAFSGQMDAVSFYDGSCDLPTLEKLRSYAIALPVIHASRSENALVLALNTRTNAFYILQSTPTLSPPSWVNIATNPGIGTTVTNILPVNPAVPGQFFRYQIQ